MPRGIPNMKSTDKLQDQNLEQLPESRDDRDYLWVMFQKGDKDAAKTVEGALNGVPYVYRRGERVCVPKEVLEECFGHAVFTQFDQETGEQTDTLSYQYSVLGPATKEEVRAFFAKKE